MASLYKGERPREISFLKNIAIPLIINNKQATARQPKIEVFFHYSQESKFMSIAHRPIPQSITRHGDLTSIVVYDNLPWQDINDSFAVGTVKKSLNDGEKYILLNLNRQNRLDSQRMIIARVEIPYLSRKEIKTYVPSFATQPLQIPDFFRAYTLWHISENTSCYISNNLVLRQQIDAK